MPEPVAPRLLGADADADILLMEDLGPDALLAGSLLTGDRSRVLFAFYDWCARNDDTPGLLSLARTVSGGKTRSSARSWPASRTPPPRA